MTSHKRSDWNWKNHTWRGALLGLCAAGACACSRGNETAPTAGTEVAQRAVPLAFPAPPPPSKAALLGARSPSSLPSASGPADHVRAADLSHCRADKDARAFYREYADKRQPAFVSGGPPVPRGAGDAVGVRIARTEVKRPLPRTLFGNNAAVWDGANLQSLNLFDRLRTANVSILRFPGGSTSDTYHFDGVYPPYAAAQGWDVMSQSWAANTAEYMYMVRRLDAIPLITVNYGYATYDTTASDGNPANAARLAADWVEYANAPNDGSNPNGGKDWAAQRARDGSPQPFNVKYWEIGNETFGFWESGYDPDGSSYAENFKLIADAMKAVDPSISIGLVTQVDWPGQPWTATVLSHPGTLDRADFLVVHDYFQYFLDPGDISATGLLAQSFQVGERKQWLDDLVAANTSKPAGSLPYYLGEYNGTIPDNPLQVSLVNGLFISKVLGELASTGWAAASFWDVLNGYDTSSGLGAGDLGFLTVGQPDVPDFTPRPNYYPFYFYTRNFGDHLVGATSSDPEVTVYASTWKSGGTGVVLINEGAASKRVTIALDGPGAVGSANAWVLTGDSLEAQQVTLNGQAASTLAGGPLPENVAPYQVEASGGQLVVTLPRYSVGSLVTY